MQPQVRRGAHSMEKWTGWDLNPRPLPCQDSDLPADLPAQWAARKLAGIKRYPHRGNLKKVPGSVWSGILNLSSMHVNVFRSDPHGSESTRGVIPPDYRWTRASGMGS